ncbi:MAG: diguanylate cyclase [Fibromonadaceae bacterium]|jgi:diguanylate cyclase (GGDEF)-like protein|nr:diguanylate cyclase [Fibromonadaceae bacterium]
METDKSFVVLIVGDNYVNLDIVKSVLSPYYTVEMANTTQQATNLLRTTYVDLIILDCPDHRGSYNDFLVNIKNEEETMKIPVILVGNASKPEEEEQSFALGAVDYISKPFRASIIKIRVNNQRLIIKQIRAIEEIGMLDTLTGIYNRRGFDNRMRLEWLRAIRDKSYLTLAIADIDYFKAYNDQYGHIQGDVLLRMLSKKFVSMLRRPADFVARWGGEEFVIVLPGTKLRAVFSHLEDIRKAVEEMVVPNTPSATISIGVASTIPTKDCSIEEFFSQADKALYKAKNTGRNRICEF